MTMEPILEYQEDLTNRGDHKAKELLDLAIRQEEKEMFIVVAQHRIKMLDRSMIISDKWSAHDDIKDARKRYKKHIKKDSCYTASICNVITSTDY